MPEGPLINIGELAKPATVLVEKISDAVGALYQPKHIKRIAAAEAEAAKIKALAQIEITEMQQRALVRFVQEEGRKHANMESITAKAIPDLKADAKPEDIENDWLTHFFERSRLVSDGEMQTVWGRLLAGEANLPGSFSKRTVDLVSTLDKSDAHLFTSLCRFGWVVDRSFVPLVFDVQSDIYNAQGIDFNSLNHLDSIGLITFDTSGGLQALQLGKTVSTHYRGNPCHIRFTREENNVLSIGHAILTQAGRQLAPISGSTVLTGFREYVISQWTNRAAGSITFVFHDSEHEK
jgi:hypothetical protein